MLAEYQTLLPQALSTRSGPLLAWAVHVHRNPQGLVYPLLSSRAERLEFLANLDLLYARRNNYTTSLSPESAPAGLREFLNLAGFIQNTPWQDDARIFSRTVDKTQLVLCQEEYFQLTKWAENLDIDDYALVETALSEAQLASDYLASEGLAWQREPRGFSCSAFYRFGLCAEAEFIFLGNDNAYKILEALESYGLSKARLVQYGNWPLWRLILASDSLDARSFASKFARARTCVVDCSEASSSSADDLGRDFGVLAWARSMGKDERKVLCSKVLSGEASKQALGLSGQACFTMLLAYFLTAGIEDPVESAASFRSLNGFSSVV